MSATNVPRKIFMSVAAATGWFGLALQLYILLTAKDNHISVTARFFNFFSYFTILTNILVALSFTIPLLNPQSKAARFFTNPIVQSATTVYIMTVGLVYAGILQKLWQPQGLQWLADVILHYTMPIVYVLFWLLYIPQGFLKWKHSLLWLIYPAVYFIYSLLRGAIVNWYPYPFIDVKENGYGIVFRNAGILLSAFILFGLIFIALDKLFSRQR